MVRALLLTVALAAFAGCIPEPDRLGPPDLVVARVADWLYRSDVAAGTAIAAGMVPEGAGLYALETMCIPGPDGSTDCAVYEIGGPRVPAVVVRFLP